MKVRTRVISGGYDPNRNYSFKSSCDDSSFTPTNDSGGGIYLAAICRKADNPRKYKDNNLFVANDYNGDIWNCNGELSFNPCRDMSRL